MNLLMDKWIPISNGEKAAPWEISKFSVPGSRINFPRPDFNLSAKLFLIGLCQLVQVKSKSTAKNPPSDSWFKKALQSYESAFNLFGDEGPLFMQDRSADKQEPIFSMLLDGIREKTLKENRDFFRKDDTVNILCPSCSAMALYMLNMFAFTGGGGYFTSPLNNMLLILSEGNSIWETIWNCTLPLEAMSKLGNEDVISNEFLFPWMASSDTKRSFDKSSCPGEHLYWINPWRLFLLPKESKGRCDCCGEESKIIVTSFLKSPQGVQYDIKSDKALNHPLSVFSLGKPEEGQDDDGDDTEGSSTKKSSRKRVTLGSFFTPSNQNKIKWRMKIPAILYGIKPHEFLPLPDQGLVTFFGTIMDQATYVGWFEKTVPYNKDLKPLVEKMLECEEKALKLTQNKITFSAFKYTAISRIEENLDQIFYDILVSNPPDAMEQWQKHVLVECLKQYDLCANRKYWWINRGYLIQELCSLLESGGIVNPQQIVPVPTSHRRERKGRLSEEMVSAIMSWWKWITLYSKETKHELASFKSYQHLQGKEVYHKTMVKLSNAMYPEKAPPSSFEDRLSLAVLLAVNLKSHKNSAPFKSAVVNKSVSLKDPLSNAETLMAVVREKKNLNVLSVFESILL